MIQPPLKARAGRSKSVSRKASPARTRFAFGSSSHPPCSSKTWSALWYAASALGSAIPATAASCSLITFCAFTSSGEPARGSSSTVSSPAAAVSCGRNPIVAFFSIAIVPLSGETSPSDVFGRSNLAYWAAMILVSLLFGFGHYYKGTSGVLDSTYSGFVLGGLFLLSGRNLWTPILAHGIVDTVAVFAVFMGWAK